MTDGTGKDRTRMTVGEARALGETAMRGAGYDHDDARILTDHVLDAALCGYEYSGLPKLLNVVDHPEFRRPRRPVAVVRETGATAVLDGGNTTGMVAACRAAEATILRAQANGVAIVCLGNTWMTGRSAYYCEMIARTGLVAIHTCARRNRDRSKDPHCTGASCRRETRSRRLKATRRPIGRMLAGVGVFGGTG